MKVLTVRQPWAWAIAHGGKDVENRATLWRYRGPLLIHAGAGWSDRGEHDRRIADAWWDVAQDLGIHRVGRHLPHHRRLPGITLLPEVCEAAVPNPLHVGLRSHVVARADLGDVHRIGLDCSDDCAGSVWAESEYKHADGRTIHDVTHLVLHNARPLPEPIYYPFGGLGLRDPRPELVAEVERQLAA